MYIPIIFWRKSLRNCDNPVALIKHYIFDGSVETIPPLLILYSRPSRGNVKLLERRINTEFSYTCEWIFGYSDIKFYWILRRSRRWWLIIWRMRIIIDRVNVEIVHDSWFQSSLIVWVSNYDEVSLSEFCVRSKDYIIRPGLKYKVNGYL